MSASSFGGDPHLSATGPATLTAGAAAEIDRAAGEELRVEGLGRWAGLVQYAVPIFLGAFLLFQVQPMIGRYILPWFGGSPAVWTTCMVFFQVLLLVGYGYAHLSISRLRPRTQGALHAALLLACLAFLPIIPGARFKPTGHESAPLRIVLLLAVTVGCPYLLLSATSPLLQAWYSSHGRRRSPYRLYALSNVGSLLALVSYPFLVEPALTLRHQAMVWSALFAVFVVFCGWCACRVWLTGRGQAAAPPQAGPACAAAEADPPTKAERSPIPLHRGWSLDRLLWLCLPACASVLLLAATHQMTQDIPVVPFLWVLPLGLYLLSFIICFDHDRWYWRPVWAPLLAAAVGGAFYALERGVDLGIVWQVAIHSGAMFVCCMVCHGELVRLRPAPRHLTSFYLMIATGGALGGLFVTVVAPNVFNGLWEYPGGLLACCVLLLAALLRRGRGVIYRRRRLVWDILLLVLVGSLALGVVVAAGAFVWQASEQLDDAVAVRRGFYGILRVDKTNADDEKWAAHYLMNGRISHGCQFLRKDRSRLPVSYYGPTSGMGLAVRSLRRRRDDWGGPVPMRLGVVGLGAGVSAAHGRKGDTVRFYEINPGVVEMSRRYFTYCKDTPAKVTLALGDARLSMERERERGDNQRFDLLVLDAFTGDSIPLHLLTKEAFAVYWHHLRPDGILAAHISNRYIDLKPLVRGLARLAGKKAVLISDDPDDEHTYSSSTWVLVTSNPKVLGWKAIRSASKPWPKDGPQRLVFTDDYANLFKLLDWD